MRFFSRLYVGCAVLALTLPLAGTLHAQCRERSKIFGSAEQAFDHFSASMATDGTVLVVGAPLDDSAASNAGAVYVFRLTSGSFVEEAHLVASDAAAADNFGTSVAVDGDRLVVGAPFADPKGADSGAAYVFLLSGGVWLQEKKLIASDGAASDRFGTSVAVQGTEVVVGSPQHGSIISQNGAAYVYQYQGAITGWQETQRLELSNAQPSDHFGETLAFDGGKLAVGVPLAGNNDSGAIQFWKKVSGSWQEDQTVTSLHSDDDHFGAVFDLRGDRLLVGMPLNDAATVDAGAVEIFEFQAGNWVETDFLPSPLSEVLGYFGSSVALEENHFVAGSMGSDLQVLDGGLALGFRRHAGVWYYDQPLGTLLPSVSDQLGSEVLLVGETALCASEFDDEKLNDSGGIFVYHVGSFLLEANATDYSTGSPLTITMSCGKPGTPAWFASYLVNGTPFFKILATVNFDGAHKAGFTTSVPPGLSGVTLTFLALQISPWSKVDASNLLTLAFH